MKTYQMRHDEQLKYRSVHMMVTVFNPFLTGSVTVTWNKGARRSKTQMWHEGEEEVDVVEEEKEEEEQIFIT